MSRWWSRNTWALLALVPLVVTAIGASSFLLVSAYLPWEDPRQIRSEGTASIPSDGQGIVYPKGETLTASFTPGPAREVASMTTGTGLGETTTEPAPGARLWRIPVDARVDADYVLSACQFSILDADGVEYGVGQAKIVDGRADSAYLAGTCFPTGLMGPTADIATDEWVPAFEGSERPEEYSLDLVVALPEGVTPARLRIDMGIRGRYWTVGLPG